MKTTPRFPGAQSLVNSTCSFEKYYEALYSQAPTVAWSLDTDATRRSALEEFFAQTPEERQKTVDSWAA
ncbi:hypothetical protein HQ346_15805 [Rhodococcus sp. BP-252]|uniref:Uncharacterized protein n=1 Tax=Rhodococcoides kyotonense TaxID=398843 RepID=A0A177YG26_9NOCA|nr:MULTISPECIES: hypothetical protein [Rhodococcus]MBY6413073.1 hypothetical protein [Rhodococcus sp. BP-320]MBY6417764.1 hypothetical protein [Rhodococcus sp. BP-321]MBY6423914.1 hypothetical protein [Rhodococcus sp. BP-324]MBY6427815.1 hypothetical protein [Rhodococcus sp. BP-323]MBY6431814.1 hypothetical protein [Rhodococcus sp. BP-322]